MGETRTLSVGVFVLSVALAGSGVAVCLLFFIFNLTYKNHRLIKMSSPNLNSLVSVGGLLLSASSLMYGVDYFLPASRQMASAMCQGRVWLVTSSFTLMYGPIFAKCWRVNQIFKKASFKRVVIRDDKLFAIVGFLLILDILLLSLWQGLDPLTNKMTTILPKTLIKAKNFTSNGFIHIPECNSYYYPAWISAIFIFKGTVLFHGLYIAWEIRNITLPSMNDSKPTVISVFTVAILGSVTTATSVFFREWPNAVYACSLMAVWVSMLVTQCLVFIPKIILWKNNRDDTDLRVTVSAHSAIGRNGAADSGLEEICQLVVENSELKKSLTEKEDLIQSLESHLNIVKDKLMQMSLEEGRQDSGLDVDLSSSSYPDERHQRQERNGSSVSGEIAQSVAARKVSDISISVNPDSGDYSVWVSKQPPLVREASLKSFHSAYTASSWKRITQLRDSIVHELSHAQNLSSDLKDSISRDLDTCHKRNSWVLDATKQDLAGSIAQSYDLSDNSDTYSYVSNYVSSMSPAYLDSSLARRDHCSSCDSLSTLGNDKLYPMSRTVLRKQSRRKHGKRNSWKRDARKKVYTIQDSSSSRLPPALKGPRGRTRSLNTDTVV